MTRPERALRSVEMDTILDPPIKATLLGVGLPQPAPAPVPLPPRLPAPAPVVAPAPSPAPPAPVSPWADLEQIGLGRPPARTGGRGAALLVSGYRLLGFAVLTLIVLVLVGYIATTTFYFFSHTWVTPVAVSASDDKVMAVRAELTTAQNQRDKLAAELDDTDRSIAAQAEFQTEFMAAIRADLEGRKLALGRVRALADDAAAARARIHRANDAYASAHAAAMAKEYAAHLIDRGAMLSGKYELAQITSSNLSLAERQADFETRAAALTAETGALDALLADRSASTPLSYDVLKIKRDYDASKLDLARAMEARRTLQASLTRQDATIAGLRASSYLRAVEDHASVALVPYGNLAHAEVGTPLYGCRLTMVVCHQVGTILAILPGEVSFKHPHRDSVVRGQLIELRLTDPAAAEQDVLFLGAPPLWL
jgi:hypothetical protein